MASLSSCYSKKWVMDLASERGTVSHNSVPPVVSTNKMPRLIRVLASNNRCISISFVPGRRRRFEIWATDRYKAINGRTILYRVILYDMTSAYTLWHHHKPRSIILYPITPSYVIYGIIIYHIASSYMIHMQYNTSLNPITYIRSSYNSTIYVRSISAICF